MQTDTYLPSAKRAQSRWSTAERAIPLRRTASDRISARGALRFVTYTELPKDILGPEFPKLTMDIDQWL